MTEEVLRGRLVLADEVVPGRLLLDGGWIRAVEPDPADPVAAAGPIYAPGFVDVHVHGWGGHDALGDADALSGMARALLRRGVTSFLPTAPTIPVDELPRFADRVRGWMGVAPDEGAHEDVDSEDWAEDVGIDGAGASAEEAAMHVIDGDGPER